MRVLMVIPAMSPEAGAEQSMAAVMPHLVRAGFVIDVVVLTHHQGLVPAVVAAGATVHDLSGRSLSSTVRALRSLIGRLRPDVVHATLFQAMVASELAAIGTGVPVVVTWASSATDRRAEQIPRWKLEIVWAAELALSHLPHVRFHAVTEGVAETRSRDVHVGRERVRVAERGRSATRFRLPEPGERDAARAALGIGADERAIIVLGRQEPQKGYVDLVRAFDRLAQRDPLVALYIAGREGSGSADLAAAVAATTDPSRVHVLGQRDDVVQLLHAADAVACSSLREGAAGALIEAMGCGAPIVSVELDGMRGVLIDGENAVVVPRDRLEEGMERLFSDPVETQRLATNAHQMFTDRFTVERSAEALGGVLRWAAGEPAPA